jgi:hypothetical protein
MPTNSADIYPALKLPNPQMSAILEIAACFPAGTMVYHTRPTVDLASILTRESDALPDVIITLPGVGLFAIHLIPGQLSVNSIGRHQVHSSCGRMEIPDQFEAASRSIGCLAIILGLGQNETEALGRAIAAPFGSITMAASNLSDWLVLGLDELASPDRVAKNFLCHIAARNEGQGPAWDDSWPDRLREAYIPLLESFRFHPDTGMPSKVGLGEGQLDAYLGIIQEPRLSISGPPGCGKTLLALERARLEVASGFRTLVTCYNRFLAENLSRALVPIAGGNLHVLNFHDTCRLLCRKAGIPFEIPANRGATGAFYRKEAPRLLSMAGGLVREFGFDSIIVDEGQDYHYEWWDSLARICQPDGDRCRLAIFHDQSQNVFRKADDTASLPPGLINFSINRSWRNTRQIFEHAVALSGLGKNVDLAGMVEGALPDISQPVMPSGIFGAVIKKLLSLLESGLEPGEIALLCPSAKSEAFCLLRDQTQIPITTHFGDWAAGARPLISTWRKFRGLEARAVVLFDLGDPASIGAQTPADLFTAATRAREFLSIIQRPEQPFSRVV